MRKNVSVILTGSGTPENLEKVLLGYNAQNYRNFEVLLLLSASEKETFTLSDALQKELFFPVSVMEIQQTVLNKELFSKVSTDYLLFAGLSAIPRYDFVEQHIKYREEGFFLSGSSNPVGKEVFANISKDTLNSGSCFSLKWLKQHNTKAQFFDFLRFSEGLQGAFLNRILCGNAPFNFENASVWKKDMEAIYDKVADVKDITKVLSESGCKPKQLKFSTVLLQAETVQ